MATQNTQWAAEPDWLQKKRQLATLLQSRFPAVTNQDQWITAWRTNESTGDGEWLEEQNGYVALPLAKAVNQYSEMLQENLMEKAIDWQENQLNAAHLAKIDSGQFIYVPDDYQGTVPISFAPETNSSNSHNVIMIGANSRVTIAERVHFKNPTALFTGTEILMGTNSQVEYRLANVYQGARSYQAVHAYQAHGSTLNLLLRVAGKHDITTSLNSFLDGVKTHWEANVVLQAQTTNAHQTLLPVLDGFGQETSGRLHLWAQAGDKDQFNLSQLKTGSGEPLDLHEQVEYLTSTAELQSVELTDSWLGKIIFN